MLEAAFMYRYSNITVLQIAKKSELGERSDNVLLEGVLN